MPDNFTHQEELEWKLTGLKNRKTSKQVVVFVKDSSNMDHFVRYRGFQGRAYSRMLHGGGAYSKVSGGHTPIYIMSIGDSPQMGLGGHIYLECHLGMV
jgi:hypothetical protein